MFLRSRACFSKRKNGLFEYDSKKKQHLARTGKSAVWESTQPLGCMCSSHSVPPHEEIPQSTLMCCCPAGGGVRSPGGGGAEKKSFASCRWITPAVAVDLLGLIKEARLCLLFVSNHEHPAAALPFVFAAKRTAGARRPARYSPVVTSRL